MKTKEIISSITEGSFKGNGIYNTYDGFIILTNLQSIKVGISNSQNCCENWGYLTSEDNDDLSMFIDAELLEIKVTDTKMMTRIVDFLNNEGIDNDSTMFVTFETTKGTFQITAYNEHNGYYGHDAVVISNSLDYQVTL
jgi:hypothetical protein